MPESSTSHLPSPHPSRSNSRPPPHDSASNQNSSDPLDSPPVILSHPSSRLPSRTASPYQAPAPSQPLRTLTRDAESVNAGRAHRKQSSSGSWRRSADADDDGDDEDDSAFPDMPSDLRPSYYRAADARSEQPLLASKGEQYDAPRRLSVHSRRRSLLREQDPELEARTATRKRYTYAAFFLVLSLISFTVQTETAVYIQHNLKWNKAYAMLYFTHGSWTMLWFLQLGILRIQKRKMPWKAFWSRHLEILRHTAQMVEHQDLQAPVKYPHKSPIPYMLKTTAFVTCALTVAGGSWYVAVDMTTASDLTAIYNCSAFFAYVFSVPILKEKVRLTKAMAVLLAIVGVIVVAYGDTTPAKHGSKSGGGAGGPDSDDGEEPQNRALGNLVIAIGSILYGLYEVLYKKLACPPEGASPGRSMIFANCFGSLIGSFTLLVLWIPLPILHFLGIEYFEWPTGEVAWMLAISVVGNAVFSGSFLVLISLTSPVLSSVAALLTIFLVALVDQMLPPPLNNPLSAAAVAGGILIIVAFAVLCWATYREMDEERKKKADDQIDDSDADVDLD